MPPQVSLGWIRTDQLPGLSAGEVRGRMAGRDHDHDLTVACLAAFESGVLSGLSTREDT